MMNIFQRVWRATMAATKAFREDFTTSQPLVIDDDFSSLDGRRSRYAINWAMYENTAYRRAHRWAESYKTAYGLYRYIRNIYNPAYRLGEFWQSHLWGGMLDPKAGDGKQTPSALPIATDIDSLRPAIAKLWEWSNWQTNKGIVTLRGAVLGDSVIKVVDDPVRRKVYMEPIHPGNLAEVTLDKWGNVKEYAIEEERLDPRNNKKVTYREEATRESEGGPVVYRTFMNGSLFAWDGELAEWSVDYGFVPMVVIQHKNVGLPWGWAEMHAGLANFREVDDQSSLLADQIRKMVNTVWFYSGVSAPKAGGVNVSASTPTLDNPEAGREDVPAIYGPAGSNAIPLISPLDITATASNIQDIVKKIERDFPELSDDLANATGDISGKALRINREPIATKVDDRRPNYDNPLVRAQQMAIAIGGYRGYDQAFAGFDLNSFAAGKLAHSIGTRPVFSKDPLDDIEIQQAFWTAAKAAKDAGFPMSLYLRRSGWTDAQIAEYENSPENKARMDAMQAGIDATRSLNVREMRPSRPAAQVDEDDDDANKPA